MIAHKCPDLLNVVKEDGFSALHLASLNGHHNVVQCLVEVRQSTKFPCCVRCNGVIWLILSCIFCSHPASSCANILQQEEAFSQEKSSTPTYLVWVTNMVSILLLWRHDVKTLISNFSKSLVITMSPLKLIQSERLEINGERLLLL